MPIRVALEQGALLEEALDALLPREPYLTYMNFAPMVRDGGALTVHRRAWRDAGSAQSVLVARDAGGQALAALQIGRRHFESQHFGLSMAKIEPPLASADEEARLEPLQALYGAACEILRERRFQHFSAVTSTHDRTAWWALQQLGAFYVGTKISWMQALTGQRAPHDLPSGLRIELIEKPAIADIDPSSWQRLYAWTATAFDRGPYVFDRGVPHERALGIYQVWTQKALTGEWADVLLVVRDGAEIVAFHTMMIMPDLSEAAGVRIVGRGIGGTLPGYRGLFTALQKECAATRPLGASYLENETQTSTIQSINVFGKLGHQCLRSAASFHMRLDQQKRA